MASFSLPELLLHLHVHVTVVHDGLIWALDNKMYFFFTDDLISTIKTDIDTANIQLEKAEMKKLQDHSFFQLENKEDKIVNGVKSH